MAMLKVHNSKVNKIQKTYREYAQLRIQAKMEGIPFDELKAAKDIENETDPLKKLKKAAKKKKKTKGFGKANDCAILMKDKDGNVISYNSGDDNNSADEGDIEIVKEEKEEPEKKKKKKKVAKKEDNGDIENE